MLERIIAIGLSRLIVVNPMTRLPLKQRQYLSMYDRLADELFRHCYLRILKREAARECMEHCFERVWTALEEQPRLPNENSLRMLLYRTVSEVVSDYRCSVSSAKNHFDFSGDLTFLLRALNDTERDVVVFYYVEGMDIDEIVSYLQTSGEVVSAALQRAGRLMQKKSNNGEYGLSGMKNFFRRHGWAA